MQAIDFLLEPRVPIMELEWGGTVYPIFVYERLSVETTLRVSKVNADYLSVAEEVEAAISR